MTVAIILLVVAGAALLYGALQRTDLTQFRPTVSLPSQLPAWPDVLERMTAAMPAVPGARVTEHDGDVLLVSAGPSLSCVSRGAGLFVRITHRPDAVLLEGRAKAALTTNASAALTEFERQLRQAVEGLPSR